MVECMSEQAVSVEVDGGVVVATMRHGRANPLSPPILEGLHAACDAFEEHGARVLVIASAAEGFFAAGADIKHMRTLDPDGFAAYGDGLRGALERVAGLDGLVIAAVDGLALGGGLELACACDLRIVGDRAQLGVPEIKLGLIPGAGGTQRLPRLIGPDRAAELMLTGRQMGAVEAAQVGLATQVVAAGTALKTALGIAHAAAATSAPALRATLRCVDAAEDRSLQDGLAFERDEINRLFADGEGQEGIAAFVERRTPSFA